MNETNGADLSNICRVCLEQSNKLYPLEGQIINVDVYVSTMISYCTSVEVILDENLPKAVCVPCFRTIRIAYNFIKQFKETNEKLLAGREMKNISIVDDHHEESVDTEDTLEIKEEIEDEQTEADIRRALAEPSSNRSSSEEKIIITYINDSNSSDRELTSVDLSGNNDEYISDIDEKPVKIEKNPSTQNVLLNRHTCPICDKIFHDFRRGLLKHLYHQHHKITLINCNKCSLGVEMSVELYVQHYTSSHLYQCPICKRNLKSRSSYHCHSRSHMSGNAYRCPDPNCKKSFLTHLRLRKHLQTHSATAKYICSKCGKMFNTYDTFMYHNKTHDGTRNHLCNVCGRAFLQAVHLKYHMWHHTGIKQFHCVDCGKSYTSVTQLKKHRRKYCGSIKQIDE